MRRRRGKHSEGFWPSIVMKKWLNIKPKVKEFSEDETESEDDVICKDQVQTTGGSRFTTPYQTSGNKNSHQTQIVVRQGAPGVPVTGIVDQRPSRYDAWSTMMREKYGIDTSEFTYNPSESNRYQQAPAQQTEERSCRCTIM